MAVRGPKSATMRAWEEGRRERGGGGGEEGKRKRSTERIQYLVSDISNKVSRSDSERRVSSKASTPHQLYVLAVFRILYDSVASVTEYSVSSKASQSQSSTL